MSIPTNRPDKVVQIVQLLENAQVLALFLDARGTIQFVNKLSRELLEPGTGQLVGATFSDVLTEPTERQHVGQRLEKLLDGTEMTFSHESTHQRRDGNFLAVDWSHTRLVQEDGSGAVLSVGLDTTARKRAERSLAWLADHDSLTKIYNRRRFESDLEKILRRAERYGHTGALFYFDIDQFKLINDTSGHKVGDDLLCQIANRLRQSVRSTDLPARVGGDEFAVVLDEIGSDEAIMLAQKLVRDLSSMRVSVAGARHQVSVSLGAVIYPAHGKTVQELLANADVAMYKAKSGQLETHGRYHLFSQGDTERANMRVHVDRKTLIENALERDRIVLVYQPVMAIADGAVHHYEALVRIRGDQDLLLSPDQFIDTAEASGLVYQIDCRVVQLACEALARLQQNGVVTAVAVNLSAHTLDTPSFTPFILEQIDRHRLAPYQLMFEITERSAVANIEAAQRIIHELTRFGCQFALDDFGMGFSSWLSLKQLPVNYVKLDGSFILRLASNSEDQILVRAMNQVAQGLGMKTIAEFVESSEVLTLLREFGVDFAQGYVIGRPTQYLEGDQADAPLDRRAVDAQSKAQSSRT
jgi:diguanylate cyclase (GGDEF)-like protein/PAS domain S-box-containing protein